MVRFEYISLTFDFSDNVGLILFIKVQIPEIYGCELLEILQVHRIFSLRDNRRGIENERAVLLVV